VCYHSSFILSVLLHLLPIGLVAHFFCKGSSSKSVKLFFSVLVQPQLLEIGSSGDVGILNRTPLHLVFLFDLFFSFLFFSLII
jgi:hypothetical protein